MLTLAKLRGRNADAVCAYHLSQTDAHDTGAGGYYAEGGESPGVWDGSPEALAALGLAPGAQVGDEMRAVMHGYDAGGSTPCVQNAGSPDRVAALDITLSTSKSVSTAIALADDAARARLLAAHNRAVDSALEVAQEDYAFTRRGKDSTERQRAHLAIARFVHSSSRDGEPATHTHCLISGTSVGVEDGRTGALAADHLYRAQATLSAAYTAQLARELQREGVQVETYEQSGHTQVRIAGWPEDLDRALSSRRDAIERHAESLGIELGEGTREAGQTANLATRRTKQRVDLQSLHETARETARGLGYDPDALIVEATKQATRQPLDFAHAHFAVDADGYAQTAHTDEPYAGLLADLTHFEVSFTKNQLAKLCYAHAARTGHSVETARTHMAEIEQHPELVRVRSRDRHAEPAWTTRTAIARDQEVARLARESLADTSHAVDQATIDAAIKQCETERGYALDQEQRAAVAHACTHSVAVVSGKAGTGKSASAQATRIALESAGYAVYGCGPSGRAASALQDGSGIQSLTIHRLAMDIKAGRSKLNNRSAVVIDEAAMTGGVEGHAVVTAARQAGARVILLGDLRQLQSVGASSLQAVVEPVTGAAVLSSIRRQTAAEDRRVVAQLEAGQALEATADLYQRGRAHVAATSRDAMREAVAAWHRDVASGYHPKDTLLMAATRSQRRALNEAAQQMLRQDGRLGKAHALRGHEGVDITVSVGDRVTTRRNANAKKHGLDPALRNGHTHTITRAHARDGGHLSLTVRSDEDGKERLIDTARYRGAKGAYLDLAYCNTNHSAQGQTTQRGHAVAPPAHLADRHAVYVAMSRAKGESHLYLSRDGVADLVADMRTDSARMAEAEGAEPTHNPDLETIAAWAKFAQRERLKTTTLDLDLEQQTEAEQEDELQHELEPELELG